MLDAASLYGCPPLTAPAVGGSATAHMGTSDLGTGWKSLVNPKNPLFWFGVVMLATVGAAGVAGSVRLGPAKLAAKVGAA